MTIRALYRQFLTQLNSIYSNSEAGFITDWVFETKAALSKAAVLENPEEEIPAALVNELNEHLRSLLQHKPLQYVTGEAYFHRLKLKVNEAVLIPRPETEELVDWILDGIPQTKQKLIDIGTGSGCISLALKKQAPQLEITAIDLSPKALEIAKENADLNQLKIKFQQLDFLDEHARGTLAVYDVIVSNPPYIPLREKEKMDINVKDYEPHLALFVADSQPLIFYEAIASFSQEHLTKSGEVFVETHEDLASEVADVFKRVFPTVSIRKDLHGKDRMVRAAY